jgi:GTPase SAR1 family protein
MQPQNNEKGIQFSMFKEGCNISGRNVTEDPNFIIKEAEEVARIFNEKIRHLNANNSLLFMETFSKSLVLAQKPEESNQGANSLDLDTSFNNPSQHCKSDHSMSPINNLEESSSSTDNKHKIQILPSKDSKYLTNTSNQNSVVSSNDEQKQTLVNSKKMDYISAEKETVHNSSFKAEFDNQKKNQKMHIAQINGLQNSDKNQMNVDRQKHQTSVTSNSNQSSLTDLQVKVKTPEVEELQIPPQSLFVEAIQSKVANVSEYNNEWMQKSDTQKQHQNDKKSLNILILGETGVGKSTWINAFANYLIYNTLEDAIAAETPVCVIPTKFSMFDENNRRHEILLGNQENEFLSTEGHSSTQNAKTYLFETPDYNIYLIDTPGMNDTRGHEQDDENVQKILRAIAPFKELHAICFLFKPNETRLKPYFRNCISKLLSNLSKNSLQNICVLFTNSRSNFYKPGNTLGSLKEYFMELKQNENVTVEINEENTFCLENEAFRLCCAYFGGVKFTHLELETYSESWEHSSQEIARFLRYAARLRPHKTSEILSINETRTWILQLVSPTIAVSDIIQANLEKLEERIQELQSIKNNIEDLQKRTAVPIISLEIIKLQRPQTVCASDKCVKYEKISGNLQPIYKTICHKDCFILNGDPSKIPDPALKSCLAFNLKGKCIKCSCDITEHRRIFYEQRIVTKYMEALKNVLLSQKDASEMKKKIIKDVKERIETYKREFNFIMTAMAKFSLFLNQNGIRQQSDIFENHIENLVECEKKVAKSVPGYDDQKYYRLADFLMYYRDIRGKVINKKPTTKLSLIDIQDIRQKLFSMTLTGPKISEIFDIHVEVEENDYAENITRCDKETVIAQSTSWYKTIKKGLSSIFGSSSN